MTTIPRRPRRLQIVPRDTVGDDGTQYADLQIALADPNLTPVPRRPRIQIEWPDSTTDTGMKYVELFDQVLGDQLVGFPNRRAFKHELARRAKLWADQRVGGNIDDMNSKEFFIELARTGTIKIFEDGVNVLDGSLSLELISMPVNVTVLH